MDATIEDWTRAGYTFQLAQKFNTTIAQIQRLKRFNGPQINVGQVLRIPIAGYAGVMPMVLLP